MAKANMREGYKFLVSEHGKLVECKEYLDIVSGLMKFIMMKVISGFDVRLGARLGLIGVRGRKSKPIIGEDGEIKGISPSWAKTFQLWKTNPEAKAKRERVFCFNEHSDGIIYHYFWHKNDSIVKNRTIYSLTFSRANKRALYRAILNGAEYHLLENK